MDSYDQNIVKNLKSSYKNIVGRIIVEGTEIDFPVVKGNDNDFYLNHNYKNQYHPFGAVFMDVRNSEDFSDMNTVLYGHNVRSGHVFHDLEKYIDPEFVKDHPYIIIDSLEERKIYEIYAVYTASAYDKYREPSYEGEELNKFLSYVDQRNILDKQLPKEELSILTLSTCSDISDRLAILAIEVK